MTNDARRIAKRKKPSGGAGDDLYSIKDAARKLRLGPEWIYDRINRSNLNVFALRDGGKGLSKQEIDCWIDELRQLKRTSKRRSRAKKVKTGGKWKGELK